MAQIVRDIQMITSKDDSILFMMYGKIKIWFGLTKKLAQLIYQNLEKLSWEHRSTLKACHIRWWQHKATLGANRNSFRYPPRYKRATGRITCITQQTGITYNYTNYFPSQTDIIRQKKTNSGHFRECFYAILYSSFLRCQFMTSVME
jgi:hypothetical protein